MEWAVGQYFSHIYTALDRKRPYWNVTTIFMTLLAVLIIKMLV